jgi:hypothetical protein
MIALALAAAAFSLSSCKPEIVQVRFGEEGKLSDSVHKVDLNSAGYGAYPLRGLQNNDVFLVKVNTSGTRYRANVLPVDPEPSKTDSVQMAAGTVTVDGEKLVRYEPHWQIEAPPEAVEHINRSTGYAPGAASTVVGSKKKFNIVSTRGAAPLENRNATLQAVGEYCKVWVVDEYFETGRLPNDKVNREQVEALAAKFDEIYLVETNLLGYEYGGGPGGNGGADGDPKIQILIFDIDGDYGGHGGSITNGYFYARDAFRQSTYPSSNEAEIFYLDSEMLDAQPESIYSTLIHEFNHMINFYQKAFIKGDYTSWNNEVWYTEMLSLLAEDVIGPLVGIPCDLNAPDNGHSVTERIPFWLYSYDQAGAMEWPSPSSSADALLYYSSNFAFGAYLMRNFGGPALLSAIAKSDKSGRASLDYFLRLFNGMSVDTSYALSRFGETLVYSGDKIPPGVFTFDRTVTETIGGYEYTFYAFDIWKMRPSFFFLGEPGPLVFDLSSLQDSLPLNTARLHSDDSWRGVSGSLDIVLREAETGFVYYLMIK